MKQFLAILLLVICVTCSAQDRIYTTANAHSHNDYEKNSPLWTAWNNKCGSIEADIFLDNGELIVAHNREQLKKRNSLDSLYLKPLENCIIANKGYVYVDTLRELQLMIDIKTEAVSSLRSLIDRLNSYPLLIKCKTLKIAISGNRPPLTDLSLYPSWLLFDGELQKEYTQEQLKRVPMFSDNFARYSSWKGEGDLPQNDFSSLKKMIDKAHGLGKKIRFWNAPDNLKSWEIFIGLGVDYINTDHVAELTAFLKKDPI
jgi:alkaline phosphatase